MIRFPITTTAALVVCVGLLASLPAVSVAQVQVPQVVNADALHKPRILTKEDAVQTMDSEYIVVLTNRDHFSREGTEMKENARMSSREDGATGPVTDAFGNIVEKKSIWGAFLYSISMIFVSEIGDKTFFIAAIMSMTQPRNEVFFGAIGALAVMTILSAGMGYALPALLSRKYTHAASILLFLAFGVKLLYSVVVGDDDDDGPGELEEVEMELSGTKKEEETGGEDVEAGDGKAEAVPEDADVTKKKRSVFWRRFFSPVFLQAFTMTFLAEWGDRSQISTIALASVHDPYGVTLGGVVGHSICTGIAVLGGKFLAQRISENVVNTVGGILFLFFAIHGWYTGPEDV